MKPPKGVIRAFDRHLVSRSLGMRYRAGRLMIEGLALMDPVPPGVEVKRGKAGGVSSRLVVPKGAPETPGIVWLHGGAYCFNSPRVYTTFAGHLARATGTSVLVPGYRLAPEHPFPAAIADAFSACRAVLDGGRSVIIGGDSAGAGLALAVAVALRDAEEPRPSGLLLMSPWVDLTLSGESVGANDGKDAILRAKHLPPLAAAYAAGLELSDPRISPLNADLTGLPPALIQCGADELFLSEDAELASRLDAAGTEVDLQVFDGMWHDFQTHAGMLPEAAGAVQKMAAWAKPLIDH